jgi:hypothetical protein
MKDGTSKATSVLLIYSPLLAKLFMVRLIL